MGKPLTSGDLMAEIQAEIQRLEIRALCTDDRHKRAEIRKAQAQKKQLLDKFNLFFGTYRKTVKEYD